MSHKPPTRPPWWEGPLLGFDTETTGTDPETARIVTAALVGDSGIHEGRIPSERWTPLVNPGIPIPAAATAVHGITDEEAADGMNPKLAVAELLESLRGTWGTGFPVVIYNAPYDLTVLDRESRRHLGSPLGEIGPVIDPLVLDKALNKYVRGTGQRKLAPTAARYEITGLDWHTSFADAAAAVHIARAIGRRYGSKLPLSLDSLMATQQRLKAQQAEELTAYFAKVGKVDEDGQPIIVNGDWPITPLPDKAGTNA